jgi:hypothetical protein
MKGQFMIISAVVIGLMLISASATVAESSRADFSARESASKLAMIEDEAEKVDETDIGERRKFRELLDSLPKYEARSEYWMKENCFNVTLTSTDETYRLNCLD